MHQIVNNLISIKKQLELNKSKSNIIAVSKTFSMSEILPLIEYGHIHFGENKVQEAVDKWTAVKIKNNRLKLHMIGKLQTNKVKYVIPLFDYIHSLDNLKLAEKIFLEQERKKKNLKIFIQVNIGNETQKSGVLIDELDEFYKLCKSRFRLNIVGLMCIPPATGDMNIYFDTLKNLNTSLGLKELSMGMSSDFIVAVQNGATYVRIGSGIFGKRY
ncbi:YggS family pyridoxal phosphate-dependent enzyme [Candidatus Pelagibacter sp.]|jgi:pyridoxal phosphate enzyme (YggS family)|nr:YggS family pyridoxal phosphate-dependent enzyme [Candidatus Pelagibacter sp.]